MPFTNFPYGVTSFGVPVLPLGISLPIGNGKAWFVDADHGNDGNYGGDPTKAFATITKAHAVAAVGDTIFVYPGSYDEAIVITKNYINLAGAVAGRYGWPDIVPSTGIALKVTGQGFTARNCRFASTDNDIVKQQGNGFIYESCVFDGDGNGATTALVRLAGDDSDDAKTASEGVIRASLFRGSGGLGLIFDSAAPPFNGVGVSDNLIESNIFVGNTGIDIATKDTGGGLYSVQRTIIRRNVFEDKNKTCYIDLTTANGGTANLQTGSIVDNDFATDSLTTTNVAMVGTGFTFLNNRDTVGVQDGSGID